MRLGKIKYLLFISVILTSCASQTQLEGNYENKFSISTIEKPLWIVRGLNILVHQYNIEIRKDSTFKVYNCACESAGRIYVKNDNVYLINEITKNENDSIEICFENYEYKIRRNGKMLIRRDGNKIERLYKVKAH